MLLILLLHRPRVFMHSCIFMPIGECAFACILLFFDPQYGIPMSPYPYFRVWYTGYVLFWYVKYGHSFWYRAENYRFRIKTVYYKSWNEQVNAWPHFNIIIIYYFPCSLQALIQMYYFKELVQMRLYLFKKRQR